MRTLELAGDIDGQHRLRAEVPENLPAGPVRLILILPDEDDAGLAWERGAALQWSDDLRDSWQDLYTLEDGQPLDAPR